MTAEIVSVGTELLLGQIVDTNAAHLGKVLAELGIEHRRRSTVGDNLARLTEVLSECLSRADIVFTIGGLGPTQDDLTREGIAAALQEELVSDPTIIDHLKKEFVRRKLQWIDSQTRQSMRPRQSQPIDNPNGTAPGLICEKKGKVVIALPGPRGEFVPMVDGPIRTFLAGKSGRVFRSRILRIVGMGEALVEQKVAHLMIGDNPTVAPYAKVGEVHLRVTASAKTDEEADSRIGPVVDEIKAILHPHVYGFDDEPIEASVVRMLVELKQTLAVAESCTGGGLGERITSIPGSSRVFLGGVTSYANTIKSALLGVSAETLETQGAVSEQCALEMAVGARKLIGSDFALSVTGIAGPGGGSVAKPVGLVYIGLSGPDAESVREYHFRGARETIRSRSETSALALLRDLLIDKSPIT